MIYIRYYYSLFLPEFNKYKNTGNDDYTRKKATERAGQLANKASDIIRLDSQPYGIKGRVLDVPLYSQSYSNLCWAYAQVMVEEWQEKQKNPSHTFISQSDATIKAIKIAKAYHKTTEQKNTYIPGGNGVIVVAGWDNYGRPDSDFLANAEDVTISTLQNALANGPLYATYKNKNTQVAHSVVVKGAVSAETHNNLVVTNTSWRPNGSENIQTLSDFKAGIPGDNPEEPSEKMSLLELRIPI